MAFMMPVMKNDYDIYKSARSRRASECSSGTSGCRSRKISECSRSDGPSSLSASPGSDYQVSSPAHRSGPIPVSRQYSSFRSSRQSSTSLQSPCKSNSSSPPKTSSSNSLNKFHNRLVDRLKRSLKCKDSSDAVLRPVKSAPSIRKTSRSNKTRQNSDHGQSSSSRVVAPVAAVSSTTTAKSWLPRSISHSDYIGLWCIGAARSRFTPDDDLVESARAIK